MTQTATIDLRKSLLRFVCFALLTAAPLLPPLLWAQETTREHIGFPVDWSSRHILYANSGSVEQRVAASRDPRFYFNWLERTEPLIAARGRFFGRGPGDIPVPVSKRGRHFRVDWAMPLGTAFGMPVGESPAKYSFNLNTYSCANDFVVYTIGATPSATQANIIAFNNLYTGTASSSCPNGPQTPPTTDYTQPTVMWSYRAGTAASYLSPTLSLDGTKVALVEDATGTAAMFDVLTWVAGQGTSAAAPATPGSGGSSLTRLSYTTASATGCNSSAANSNSSAYIDYTNDVAYIGADNGILYRITNVFAGTPTVQYCITVNKNKKLTSPVYNESTNVVYVSDGFSVYAYTVGAAAFAAAGSIQVASTSASDPIVLSPIIDVLNGFVYVFSGADLTNAYSIVSQMNLALTSQATAEIGPTTSQFILDGDFDNAYYTIGMKGGAGTLYACGTQAGAATKPALYALSFSAPNGIMNSTPVMSGNVNINGSSNPAGTCSPLLDFYDGTNDHLFVGTGTYSSTAGANLVTQWNTNTQLKSSSDTPINTTQNYWGGTSAFTVDNINPTPQATSIYFGTLSAPPSGTTTPCGTGNYCAVKLTQDGLQ
jgi:hypothetical protein